MKRILDVSLSLIGVLILLPVIFLISILIKITSKGPIIFKQKRVGRYSKEFYIFKFRTMRADTPNVATKDLKGESYLTPIGGFLRRTSLDEIPQLFNVIKGDMSLVGPRPIIKKEEKLIKLRSEKKVDTILPGITGWAQINGRDNLSIEEKVSLDEEYMLDNNLFKDIKILIATVFKVIKREGILY